jgi:hypothetical protein
LAHCRTERLALDAHAAPEQNLTLSLKVFGALVVLPTKPTATENFTPPLHGTEAAVVAPAGETTAPHVPFAEGVALNVMDPPAGERVVADTCGAPTVSAEAPSANTTIDVEIMIADDAINFQREFRCAFGELCGRDSDTYWASHRARCRTQSKD